MSHTSRSVLAFGVYVGILGTVLVLIPDPLLALLGLPPAQDYWILVVGMLLVGLAAYYMFAALNELRSFMQVTAIGRSLVLAYFIVLVVLRKAPAPILIFGAVDMLFAVWTFIALRQDQVQASETL